MATQIIQFPHRGTTAAPASFSASVTTSVRQAQPAAEHHRGLHLVTSTTTYNTTSFDPFEPGFEDTQARANRIVAQVEQEIARQATRQRQYQLTGSYPATPLPLPAVTSIETPASVARRIFTALLSFARPA